MLEATMIVIDNSEPSRNGDYLPTRYDAQSDAAHLLFQAKTSSNPESAVGLMCSAGASPSVLTTLTTDEGRLHHGLASTRVTGKARVATALSVAALALKHRQNKSQHQRVVVFTCSGVGESREELVKLGKKLKKGGVAVDVVVMGEGALESAPAEEDEGGSGDAQNGEGGKAEVTTRAKWTAFYNAIKGPVDAEHQSHLAILPPGPSLLSDALLSTDVMAGTGMGMGAGGAGGDMGEGAGAGAGGFDDFGGMDANADPDLALALRMSMEEEERRQQAQAQRDAEGEGTALETVMEEGKDGEGGGEKKGGGEGGAGGSGGAMDTS